MGCGSSKTPHELDLATAAASPKGTPHAESIVSRFLEEGASPDSRDDDGWPALCNAAREGNVEILARLQAAGADLQARSGGGGSALMISAGKGHADAVSALIGWGGDVDAADNKGNTALIRACYYGHLEAVRLLLEAGADAQPKAKNGRSARDFAQERRYLDIVDLLEQHEAGPVARALEDDLHAATVSARAQSPGVVGSRCRRFRPTSFACAGWGRF